MRPSRSTFKQIAGATILLVAAAAIFFPASLFWNAAIRRHPAQVLAQCGTAPDFESKDQAGHPIGAAELRGHIWVADFVRVTDQREGELLSSKFFELDQNFQKTNTLALVSFCIDDPGIDQIAQYAQSHEASAGWHFIGTPGTGTSTVVERWRTAVTKCGVPRHLENCFVLIDQAGEIRGAYDATAPEVVQKILIDVGNLLRAEHRSQ